MVAKLTIDPKALAGKSEDEKLLHCCEAMLGELEKSALARDNEGIAALRKEITDQWTAFETRQAALHPQFSLPGLKVGDGTKKDEFSLHRAALGFRHNDWSLAPLEGEVFNSKEHRDFIGKAASFGVDAAGGFLIPSEVSGRMIEKLQAASIAFQLGVQQMDVGNVASLTFNRETGDATATWVGEMATAAASQIALGQMTVSPKALSAKGDLSNLLMLLGSNAAEQRFINNASKAMARGVDRGILIGPSTVSNKAPVGIAGTIGVQTSTTASLTYDMLVDFEDKLRTANAYTGKLGWAMTEAQRTVIRKLKDTTGQPILLRSLTEKGISELFGFPIASTTAMGTTGANTLAFGAWDQATLYRWFGGIIMKRSDSSDNALDNDLTRVTLRMYCDVGVDQPTAFCYASA